MAGPYTGNAIEVENLSKRFPKGMGYLDILIPRRRRYVQVLDGVNLQVPSGQVLGLVGPNGVGKTTLLKILIGLVSPDSGSVRVKGVDSGVHSDAVNVLSYVSSDERSLYWRLTGRQNLTLYAKLDSVPSDHRKMRTEELLEAMGLTDSADEKVATYSSGMKQKLLLARGLLANPDVLLLDEPTRSLDPAATRQFWDTIKDEVVKRDRKTVVLATHSMEEASYLCDRVAIMDGGKIQVCEPIDSLLKRFARMNRLIIKVAHNPGEIMDRLRDLDGVRRATLLHSNGNGEATVELGVDDIWANAPRVIEYLVRANIDVVLVEEMKASLGDVIMEVMEDRVR
jgi:ABC-2 type transport system ATP-binding protein